MTPRTSIPEPAPRRPSWRHRVMVRLINLYPPFLGAGIRVRRLRAGDPDAPDGGPAFRVRMRLTVYNRNYFGTQFGGALYMMCDPFYLLVLLEELGPGYVVWDKAATIRFRRPGLGTVSALFQVPRERIAEIRAEVERAGKAERSGDKLPRPASDACPEPSRSRPSSCCSPRPDRPPPTPC